MACTDRTPVTFDAGAQAVEMAAARAREAVPDQTATVTASSFKATRKRRAARPTDGTSKIIADDYIAAYQRAYRDAHPETVLRWRVTAARKLLVRMGAVVTWPNGDPTAPPTIATAGTAPDTFDPAVKGGAGE